MPLPLTDTRITFPGGSLTERGTVVAAVRQDAGTMILTDVTPFHPVDPRWPDQGPDRGVLRFGDREVPVAHCVVGATDGSGLFVGDDVPVRRGEPGWAFVVVHQVADGETPAEGAVVELTVDGRHRYAVSAGHSGCHTAALALNEAMTDRWRKDVRRDSLGHPFFDQLAITASVIEPFGSIDSYRIGKSLRKKGFDPDGLADALPAVTAVINDRLAQWVASGAPMTVETAGPGLSDLREWACRLPEGEARIPCGGTHLASLAELTSISVTLDFDEPASELVMRTSVAT